MLADPGPAEALAEWLADADRLVTLARGLLLGAAREVALKVAETTSLTDRRLFVGGPPARPDSDCFPAATVPRVRSPRPGQSGRDSMP